MITKEKKKTYDLKDFEKEIADFFILWVNKEYGLDYKTLTNKEYNSETDIFAISRLKKPKLLIQITKTEGETDRVAWNNYKNKKMDTIDVKLIEWILGEIKKKHSHYQPSDIRKELILLISVDFLNTYNKTFLLNKLKEVASLDFKGVYLIQRSEGDHFKTSGNKKGLVIPLKDI